MKFSGTALARARGSRTQEDLARDAGVSLFTISRLERGLNQPGSETVGKLATALGVTPTDLYTTAEAEVTV